MIEGIAIFALIALLVEAVWETLKMGLPKVPGYVDRVGVMGLAVFLCVGTGSDLFSMLGMDLPGLGGEFFSGILCSRGANFIHDTFKSPQKNFQ